MLLAEFRPPGAPPPEELLSHLGKGRAPNSTSSTEQLRPVANAKGFLDRDGRSERDWVPMPERVIIQARDYEQIARVLRQYADRGAGRSVHAAVNALLGSLKVGEETLVRIESAATPAWMVWQPQTVSGPDDFLFPVPYPYGFGGCPVVFAFHEGHWRQKLLADGYLTLDDLTGVRFRDLPSLDDTLINIVLDARRRVDDILAGQPLPPGGYPRLPVNLSYDIPARDLLKAIACYLPVRRREIFERTFGLLGTDRTPNAVARTMGIGGTTPKEVAERVVWTLTHQYRWRQQYGAILRNDATCAERWLAGLTGTHRKLLDHLLA